MTTEKKKVAVLTLSQQYQKGHPKEGQPTEFIEKLKAGVKLHTIRSNYELWAKRAEQINAGKMVLSIRVWSGKPYRSQQVEVARLTKLGVQRVCITRMGAEHEPAVEVDGRLIDRGAAMLSKNDGLDYWDWFNWFLKSTTQFEGVILQFTDMRY